jgi:hypothetical protein
MNVYDEMLLDLVVSSKCASKFHNNTGNRKNLSANIAIWKGDPQHSLQIFGLSFTFG